MISTLRRSQTAMNLDSIKKTLNLLLQKQEVERAENRQKLSSIIEKLSIKKARLKDKLKAQGEQDETSDSYIELDQEYQVVSKLLSRARQAYSEEFQPQEQQEESND